MKSLPIIGVGTLVVGLAVSACVQGSRIDNPALCGQTTDGSAIVVLPADTEHCTRQLGQKLIIVAEKCGPLMPGSNAVDDCWRGNIPGVPSPDNFRLGTIQATGGQAINLVASDATAP